MSSAFFQNQFFDFFFRNTTSVSNSLDSDQARHYGGPGLGPNCSQKLSADNSRKQRVNQISIMFDTLSVPFINFQTCLIHFQFCLIQIHLDAPVYKVG